MTFCILANTNHAFGLIKCAITQASKLLCPITLCLAGLISLAPGFEGLKAQTDNDQRFDNWRLACRATGVNETSCRLVQTLLREDDRRFLAEISLAAVSIADETQHRLVLRTPTRMLLSQPPAFRIGDAAAETQMAWRTCGPRACVATLTLTDEQVRDLRESLQMVVGYRVVGQPQNTVIEASLLGVTAGLDALSEG